MLFEEGDRIRSRRTFDLDRCTVDGMTVYAEDYYDGDTPYEEMPYVGFNQEFEILSLSGGYAVLRNLDECRSWNVCEIEASDLDDFELCY